MHAYLLIGKNLSEKITELTEKLKGRSYEFPVSKIEDVRELSKFLKLTQAQNTIVITKDIDNSTTEALNAFLKNLEEPQTNISFILTANNEHKVLPTILSRCQIIRVRSKPAEIRNDEFEVYKFFDLSTGEKFVYIDKIKNRPEAIEFVQSLIEKLHTNLLTDKSKSSHTVIAKRLELTQETLNKLEANGNVNLQLSNLVVNLVAGPIAIN